MHQTSPINFSTRTSAAVESRYIKPKRPQLLLIPDSLNILKIFVVQCASHRQSLVSNNFLTPFEFNTSGFDCARINPIGCHEDANFMHKTLRDKISAQTMMRAPHRNEIKVQQVWAESWAQFALEPRLPSAVCNIPVKCHRD